MIDGEREFTYREFAERTHRLANALLELGIEPGDRVSFITYNTHHLLEAYYGVLEAGAVLNPINIRLAPHEIAWILDHAGSKVVFFHRDFLPLVEQIGPGLKAGPAFVVLDGEAGGIAGHEYEGLLATGRTDPLAARDRRERAGRAVLHERHDRPAQGRGDDPPPALPAQPDCRARAGLHRGTTSSSTSCPCSTSMAGARPTS